jgi:hypothetical protein
MVYGDPDEVRVDVVQLAWPLFRLTDAHSVTGVDEPYGVSENETDPSGFRPSDPDTVAVNVVVWPDVGFDGDEVKVVVVATLDPMVTLPLPPQLREFEMIPAEVVVPLPDVLTMASGA